MVACAVGKGVLLLVGKCVKVVGDLVGTVVGDKVGAVDKPSKWGVSC